MKVIRYILVTVLMLSAFSCADIDLQPEPVMRPGLIQIIPRVISFNNAIDTKSDSELIGKENAETDLTCMALVIFDNNGKCIDFQFKEGNDMSFIIDRKVLARADDDDQTNNVAIDNASIYAFANIPSFKDITDWSGKEIGYFDAIEINVTGVTIPTSGLPMRGVYYGKEDADKNPLPYVDLDPEKTIASPLMTIDMYSAYAKVFVSLSVDAAEFETLGFISSFTPTSWQVFNVPKTVDFMSDTNSPTDVTDAFPASTRFEGVTAIGTDKISFTFYLPERYLTGENSEYKYPFAGDDGSIRDEDLGLRQKYKKEHLTEYQKATYVKLSGTFSDYQGHKKRMEYDLYVGGNEYDDFNIKRNALYTNNVVIRATKQSNDPDFMNTVSYDGRVNIDESAFIVKLERETVLDSHWEIRPMRVSVLEGSVTVSIENAASTPWIRMENSTAVESAADQSKYLNITNKTDVRYGKRKYFTTNLLSELSSNVQCTLDEGEHCIWVYVDENTSETIDAVRTAVISFDDGINEPLEYTIAQAYLLPIETKRKENNNSTYTYSIETHEEYLYNYDAMSGYGHTEYNGMPWGLEGIMLSHIYPASQINYTTSGIDWIIELFGESFEDRINKAIVENDQAPYYDFYLTRDNAPDGGEVRDFNGKQFNVEIAEYLIENYAAHQGINSTESAKINGVPLDEDPFSAFSYCYNKNKRNANGEVVFKNSDGTWNTSNLKWYLPAIDEIEDIAEFGYGIDDVFQENLYWSCQPAFARNNIAVEIYTRTFGTGSYNLNQAVGGNYYEDYPSRARATMASFKDGEFEEPVSSAIPDGVNYGTLSGQIRMTKILPNVDESNITYNETAGLVVDYNEHEGNLPRSASARVRCVYKP